MFGKFPGRLGHENLGTIMAGVILIHIQATEGYKWGSLGRVY